MENSILVFVVDANDEPVAGASVSWKVQVGGNAVTLGPVTTQGFSTEPAEIMLPDGLENTEVEVTAKLGKFSAKRKIDFKQTRSIRIPLATPVVPPTPTPAQDKPEPWTPGSGGWFLLTVFVVLCAANALLAVFLPWYTVTITLVASLVGLVFIGALSQHGSKALSEKGLLAIIDKGFFNLRFFKPKD